MISPSEGMCLLSLMISALFSELSGGTQKCASPKLFMDTNDHTWKWLSGVFKNIYVSQMKSKLFIVKEEIITL